MVEKFFDIADKLGSVLIALAAFVGLYLIAIALLRSIEKAKNEWSTTSGVLLAYKLALIAATVGLAVTAACSVVDSDAPQALVRTTLMLVFLWLLLGGTAKVVRVFETLTEKPDYEEIRNNQADDDDRWLIMVKPEKSE